MVVLLGRLISSQIPLWRANTYVSILSPEEMCKFLEEEKWYWSTDTTYTGILFIFHHETWILPRRYSTLWFWFGREALGKLQRQCYEKVTKFLPLLKNLPKCSLHQYKYLLSTVILLQHGPKLCPCQPRTRTCCPASNFIPWEDQKKLPGVHGLPSTLVKEQREKAVPIKILGIFTQTFTLQLSITPLKNSLQCVTRNILLFRMCKIIKPVGFSPKLKWKGEGN